MLYTIRSKPRTTIDHNSTPVREVALDPINPPPPTSKSTNFNIENFYNSLQNGMSPDEVIKLAGKQPDDCAMTDSIPPSETCFWHSGNKTVTVSYGNKNAVQTKAKSGF